MTMNTKKFKYPVEVFWSEEDKGYIARVPALPGCSAWGVTKEEVLKEVQDAIEASVKVAKKMNRAIS